MTMRTRSFQHRQGISIDLAQPEDDESLRALLGEMPMPGDISLQFRREPNFFEAARVEGNDARVIVGRRNNHDIIGMATCSQKPGYVNGQLSCFGYLSSLRVRPECRSLPLLNQGFRFLKEVLPRPEARLYLAMITRDNGRAEKVLTSWSGRLPYFEDYGEVLTLVLRARPFKVTAGKSRFVLRRAKDHDMDALLEFWHTHGLKRQFFPRYERVDFVRGLLRGLQMSDIFLALDHEDIIGTLGFWDQSAFKQNVVYQYSRRLKKIRWALNAYAHLRGRPILPEERAVLRMRAGAVCCIKHDDKKVFRSLLSHGLSQPEWRGLHGITLGFHEKDPLLGTAMEFQHHLYRSRLYVVHWEDGQEAFEALDGRVPYIEIGGL